ncbi:hypothetical protein PV10_03118 [Exophiala mesophila]|uniref:Major facilitator superfamily (MFS) profile domain-containing protein n=1 Tax=Exophiala mesophila TaxID=212818 RepID=A0A0D1ZNF1_EXOME|nr:uncharacterized protein PV10_03118 [Exophiala mesophila]KIV95464.1 hypothetical protein PV10_03118 [Exophiala mesophila]
MLFKKSPKPEPEEAGGNPATTNVAKSQPQPSKDGEYPSTGKAAVVIIAMMAVSFLVALDRTIVATAIPVITNHFDSLNDVGWYASSYLLTTSTFQLLFGRVYTFYDPKWVYLCSITLFELGSLVCGSAQSSTALIIGRAIAGMGSAGTMSGAIVIMVHVVPLEKRPALMGSFGAVFAIASVSGPLLGGLFTDKVSWRWCFYINLPIGGLTMILIYFILHLPDHVRQDKLSWKTKLNKLDPVGTAFFMPSIICLLLALQWGGITYAWSDARIIVLLVLSGILIISFIFVQHWRQEFATLPPRILKHRSIIAGFIYSFFSGANMIVFVYFLQIWFQAIKGVTAVHAGIMNIPAILALTLAALIAGIGTKKIGYYTQWMYLSTVMSPIGAGLISTFTTTTNHQAWIGYQVIWGLGLGLGMQQPSMAAQTVLSKADIPTGISIMFFAQTLGGAVIVSIANNIFGNKLGAGLATIPGVDGDLVAHIGATDLRKVVTEQALPAVLEVYNLALRYAFYVGTAVACATVFGTVPMQWINLNAVAAEQKAAAAAAASAQETATAAKQSPPESTVGAEENLTDKEEGGEGREDNNSRGHQAVAKKTEEV